MDTVTITSRKSITSALKETREAYLVYFTEGDYELCEIHEPYYYFGCYWTIGRSEYISNDGRGFTSIEEAEQYYNKMNSAVFTHEIDRDLFVELFLKTNLKN